MATITKPMSFLTLTNSVGIRKAALQVAQPHTRLLSITRRSIVTESHSNHQPSQVILHLRASPPRWLGSPSRLSVLPSLDVLRSTSTIQVSLLRATIFRAAVPTLAEAVMKWASTSRCLTHSIENNDHVVSQEGQADSSLIDESSELELIDCGQDFYAGLEDILNSSGTEQIDVEVVIVSPAHEEPHSWSQDDSARFEEVGESNTGDEGKNKPDELATSIIDMWGNDPEMAALFASAGIKL